MGENGAKNYKTLVENNSDFKQLSKELIKFCGIDHSEKDLLWGKTKIFLNLKFSVALNKVLRAK